MPLSRRVLYLVGQRFAPCTPPLQTRSQCWKSLSTYRVPSSVTPGVGVPWSTFRAHHENTLKRDVQTILCPPSRTICSTESSGSSKFVDHDPDTIAAESLLDSLYETQPGDSTTVTSEEASRVNTLAKAKSLAEAAASRGSPRAKALLGYLYRDGLGVATDATKAQELFLDAAREGDPFAQLPLGMMILESLASHPGAPSTGRETSQSMSDPDIVVDLDDTGAPKARYNRPERNIPTEPETPAQLVRKIRKARNKAGFADHEAHQFSQHQERTAVVTYQTEREKGITWLREAANQACDEATVALANALLQENPREALELYELAANRSHVPSAHFNLGQLYSNGTDGCEKNEKLALKHFSMAAQLGDADAQFFLGHLYRAGEMGVEADQAGCRQYVELAAKQGHPGALYYLALLYRNGEGGLEVSRGNFRRYVEAAAELEYSDALACLADMYYKGTDGARIDKEKALQFYERAGRAGNEDALCSAAAMYFHGHGTDEPDMHRAFLLYQDAALRGSIPALRNIGAMYYNGDGIPKSLTVAEQFFKEADALEKAKAKDGAAHVQQIGVQHQEAKPRSMPHTEAEAELTIGKRMPVEPQ